MHSPKLSGASASAALSAVADRLAGGSLDLYDGLQPSSPDVAPTGQLLARITLSSPAFDVSTDGSAALHGVPLTGLVVQTGSAEWARFSRALTNGGSAELDAAVGTADTDPDIVTATAMLQVGSIARILSFSLSLDG